MGERQKIFFQLVWKLVIKSLLVRGERQILVVIVLFFLQLIQHQEGEAGQQTHMVSVD